MKITRLSVFAVATMALAATLARAGAPTAVINASPDNGRAPLAVLFDASLSSADVVSYLWDFGDGAASTAKTSTHSYTVAGTYTAKLTVTNAEGLSASAQLPVTVTGTGEGPVTGNMNFRWATTAATFKLNHSASKKDKLQMFAAFNIVDLPDRLKGLAASFTINGLFTVSGVLGEEGVFMSPEHAKPEYTVQVDKKEQQLRVYIAGADMGAAFAASGAGKISATGLLVPVTFSLTVGAQTYVVTEKYSYTSTPGGVGTGTFNLKKKTGAVQDGFFVVSRGSAIESLEATGHFFEFETYLSRPLGLLLDRPVAGTFSVKLNAADPTVILFDRIRRNGTKLVYDQPDRAAGGISLMTIDTVNRRMTIRTWDLLSDTSLGGTGLPLRGQNFTTFNFTVRLDFDQPDGTTLQSVTATHLTRLATSDAFWQTGRKRK
jgi:PKD repeat protein